MPFRDKTVVDYVKDQETNRITGYTETEKKEQMPACFLGDTPGEADHLYQQFEKLITSSASYYAEHTGLDRKDLIQEAWIGLARAKRDFEIGRSKDFKIFAIYKVKEALREFVSKQELNIGIPYYIKETCRLINKLHSTMQKAGVIDQFCDYNTIWDTSAVCKASEESVRSITGLRDSINNIASRSQTSTVELLKRAEIYPVMVSDENVLINQDIYTTSENDLLNEVQYKIEFDKIKEHLTDEEFELLVRYFVYEMSVRELAPLYNISSSHVANRITDIVNRLRRKKKVLHYYEENNNDAVAFKEGNRS